MSIEALPHETNLSFPESVPGFLKALVDNVEDGIVVSDTVGRIVYSNNAAVHINDDAKIPSDPNERVHRYSVKVGDNEFPMEAQDLPLLKVLRDGEIKKQEVILLSSKGQRKILICDGRTLYGDRGNKLGAVLILHDKTHQRQIENHEANLMNERNELLHINRELERFSSIAAHDLKSPLNSITSFAEILTNDYGDRLGPEGMEILQIMRSAGKRLRTLIDDLLAYARSGQDLGTKSNVETKSLVDEVLLALQGEIKKTKAQVQIANLPNVYADRIGLCQVFQNLISNALKYGSDVRPLIQISALEQTGYTLFQIKDNGIGIPIEDQKVVFDLFKRLDGSMSREGTGLGLPICKRIIELHRGSVWLTSEKGQGTTVFFTIPKEIDPSYPH